MNKLVVWSLLPVFLFLLGVLMLWLASWRQQRRSGGSPFARPSIFLTVFGWIGLIVGAVGIAIVTSYFFAPLVLLGGAIIIVAGVFRYWRSEYRYLVWSLAEAAQRGIPLEKAAWAFAGERGGGIGSSARRLADYLDAAVPLSVAMVRSGIWVSPEIRMAADMGEKTGALGRSLKHAIAQSNAYDNTLGSALAKFIYLSCIVSFMSIIVTFMMLKIVPTFAQMFEEFELMLPATTQLLIFVSRIVVEYWYLLSPMLLLMFALLVVGILVFVGVPLQSIPLIRQLARPIDNAAVLNSLAIAVHQKQSISDNLALLSGLARSPRSQRKLRMALEHIESGAHWTEALHAVGLITKPQVSVIRSAERTGNLSWALNEMADSTIRLTAHRTNAVLNFVFPACLLAIGFCVLFIVVGMMLPLFDLIRGLA